MTGVLIGGIGHRFSKCLTKKVCDSKDTKNSIIQNINLNIPQVSKVKTRYQRQLSARLMMLKKGLIFFVPWFIVFLVLPAIIFSYIEKWTFIEGFYYSFVTLSTIGFGDYVAGSFEKEYIWVYKLTLVLWIIFGLAYLSMILNFISQGLRSRHLSNVVHSIRRMSGPPFSNKLSHLSRIRRNRSTLHRQQSVPINLITHNGKVVRSEISSNSSETSPITSSTPSYSQQQSFNDPFENSKPERENFFHILKMLPFFKHSPKHRKVTIF